MSVPTGPRTIQYVDRPLRAGLEVAGALGMVVRLGEVGEPAPGDTDSTWHHIDPVDPAVWILLHQTDRNRHRPILDGVRLWPEPASWIYTLGPFKGGPLVHAVRAHWTRRLSLALRARNPDGSIGTAYWHDVQLAVDFDRHLSSFWLDWTARPDGQGAEWWMRVKHPELAGETR